MVFFGEKLDFLTSKKTLGKKNLSLCKSLTYFITRLYQVQVASARIKFWLPKVKDMFHGMRKFCNMSQTTLISSYEISSWSRSILFLQHMVPVYVLPLKYGLCIASSIYLGPWSQGTPSSNHRVSLWGTSPWCFCY